METRSRLSAGDSSYLDDRETSDVGYDLDDMDDDLGPESRRLSDRFDVPLPKSRSRARNDGEFRGPWVESVSSKGDVFYLEKELSSRRRQSAVSEISRNVSLSSKDDRTNSRGRNTPKSSSLNGVKDNGGRREHVVSPSHGTVNGVDYVPDGRVKTVVLPLRTEKNKYKQYVSECERLLGILPGCFGFQQDSGSSVEKKIAVQGLIPDGVAQRSGVKIGDWLMAVNDIEVNADNFIKILSVVSSSSEKQVKLTLQKVSIAKPRISGPVIEERSRSPDAEDELSKHVAGVRLYQPPMSQVNVLHGAFYLRLDINSEELKDKEDVVYHYPRSGNSELLDLRGAFGAIGQMAPDVTGTTAKNSSATIKNQLVHVAYHLLDKTLFLLCVPAARVSIVQLNHAMRDIVRIMLVLYGSVKSAFEQTENRSELDHFFSLAFRRLLLSQEVDFQNNDSQEFLEPFVDALGGMRALVMPEPTKVTMNDAMSDFESADFADMSESYYNVRRSYTILGSCLFYKGYLLANHLPKDDATDLNLFLRYHGLLTLANEEQLGHLVVWREIFPTRRCHRPSAPIPGYVEPNGRFFLLVVGMRNAVLGALLEAGGCAEKAQGHPTPDPFYIDQANATLSMLETMDVFNDCELRLMGPPVPSLSCVDWFIPTKGVKGYQTSPSTAFVQPRPPKKKIKPESILKKKDPIGSSASLTNLSKQDKYSSKGSLDRFSSENDVNFDTHHVDDDYDSSDFSDDDSSLAPTRFKASSSDMLSTSTGSRLFKGPKQNHNLLSMYDISGLKKSEPELYESGAGSLVKLPSGCQNTLFQYVFMDGLDGVFICPAQQELRHVSSLTHKVLLKNFNVASLEVHRVFEESKRKVREYGMLFQCPLVTWHDTKKSAPSTSYWVVGRLFDSPVPSEFYVCFQDSAQQNVVEFAFKLIQGTLLS